MYFVRKKYPLVNNSKVLQICKHYVNEYSHGEVCNVYTSNGLLPSSSKSSKYPPIFNPRSVIKTWGAFYKGMFASIPQFFLRKIHPGILTFSCLSFSFQVNWLISCTLTSSHTLVYPIWNKEYITHLSNDCWYFAIFKKIYHHLFADFAPNRLRTYAPIVT